MQAEQNKSISKSSMGKLFFQPSAGEAAPTSAVVSYEEQLLAIAGIGPKLAAKISAVYSSPESLAEVTAKQISETVRGVSQPLARKIKAVFKETEKPLIANVRIPAVDVIPPPEQPVAEQPALRPDREKEHTVSITLAPPATMVTVPAEPVAEPEPVPSVEAIQNAPETPIPGTIELPGPAIAAEDPLAEAAPVEVPRLQIVQETTVQSTVRPERPVPISDSRHFKTFSKPEVHLSFVSKKNETPHRLPAGLILLGLGCILLGSALFFATRPPATPASTVPYPQSVETAGVSENPYLRALTFSPYFHEQARETAADKRSAAATLYQAWADDLTTRLEQGPPIPIVTADVSVAVLNGSGIRGAAKNAGDLLTAAQFNVTEVANADRANYQTTTIFYAPDNVAKAEIVRISLSPSYTPVMTAEPYAGKSADVVVVIGLN